jgi:signal transduction histidine kinase/CheY-like chemotaxis protein
VSAPLLSIRLRYEEDVVLARQRGRQLAAALGFDPQDQTRIATAVSEIARNAFRYARDGRVDFSLAGVTHPQVLTIVVRDSGPGVADLPAVLEGRYRSQTGMGLGIAGARRLMDRFIIDSRPGSPTTVEMQKMVPRGTPLLGPEAIAVLTERLTREAPRTAAEEVQQQNQELLRTLEELTRRQREIAAINRELEDTNRGVVALYAELNEKADHLRRADEIKTRFISNMSHEFRTPVNSIQALARLLIDRTDGDLTAEQERQVLFIRQSADALSEIVNDLLDLAKIEAGKTVVRPDEFLVSDLFGALRGMLRPLLVGDTVSLVFEEPTTSLTLCTDEGKVSQILRNFISNALKFTSNGEVRVSATSTADGQSVTFSVSDTGIGIAADDLERIFQEFAQVESPVQRRVKGTGLGLPLCRRLAELLGGTIAVESREGLGSTFRATVPIVYAAPGGDVASNWQIEPTRTPVLVVEDNPETILVYEKYLAGSGFQMLPVYSVREAREALAVVRPRAVLLDISLRGEDGWGFLMEMKRRDELHDVPVMVVTTIDDERKAIALGADAFCLKPVERRELLHVLTRLTAPYALRRILIVDDEEISRYVLRQHLMTPEHVIWEAASGEEAVRVAREERPDVVCLDLNMPEADGRDVLRRLKADPTTASIPVVVVTAQPIDEDVRRSLTSAAALLPKQGISRASALAMIEAAIRGEGSR